MEQYRKLCDLRAHTVDFEERVLDILAQAGIWLSDVDAIICEDIEDTKEYIMVIKNRIVVEAYVSQNKVLSAKVLEAVDGEHMYIYRYEKRS